MRICGIKYERRDSGDYSPCHHFKLDTYDTLTFADTTNCPNVLASL